MYTTLHIGRTCPRASESHFFEGLVAACNRLDEPNNAATNAEYAGMRISLSPWGGIACQFGQRLLRLPDEFEGLIMTHVTMTVPTSKYTPGVYVRRLAYAVVEEVLLDFCKTTIEGDTLAAVNRLLKDIQSGVAQPTWKDN
jgi:hypothetical protein